VTDAILNVSRGAIYDSKSIPLNIESPIPPREICELAEPLFAAIKKSFQPGARKIDEKRDWWYRLFFAGIKAYDASGCVRYGSKRTVETPAIMHQVIDCAVEAGYFRRVKSTQTDPLQSRLVPLPALDSHFPIGSPYSAGAAKSLVELRSRGRGKNRRHIPFDKTRPTALHYKNCLELINVVNAQAVVTYQKKCSFVSDYRQKYQEAWPVYRAVFTEKPDLTLNGRLYTSTPRGVQQLTGGHRGERRTLLINGQPTVEIDYSGFHPRLLYHRLGIAFNSDPYEFGPEIATRRNQDDLREAKRDLNKQVLNAAINARSPRAAINACKGAARFYNYKTNSRKWGKKLKKAIKLRAALESTGLSFAGIYDAAVGAHGPVGQYFCSDAGLWLMNLDGKLALDIMHYFACRNIPCLSVHDSFIVDYRHEAELRGVMIGFYHERFGFDPKLKTDYGFPPPPALKAVAVSRYRDAA
jgi:hypothetical protein